MTLQQRKKKIPKLFSQPTDIPGRQVVEQNALGITVLCGLAEDKDAREEFSVEEKGQRKSCSSDRSLTCAKSDKEKSLPWSYISCLTLR